MDLQPFIAISLVNLLTSLDNVIVVGSIASRYKNLVAISLVSTIVITLCRTLVILGIGTVSQWPGFRFTLGIAVLVVALNLAYVKAEDGKKRDGASFWRILVMVVATDMALSVDNVLSISMISKNPVLVSSSVFISLLPLFMLLPIVMRTMNQVAWLRILAAGFLGELAVDSMTDDPWLALQIPQGRLEIILRVATAAAVVVYGFWRTYRKGAPS